MTPPPGEAESALRPEDMEQLPSYGQFYKKFDTGRTGCEAEPWVQGLKDTVDGHHSTIEVHMDKIVGAWCCMSKMPEGNNLNYNERCNFLYYWIGDFLFGELGDDAEIVMDLLNSICKYIKSTYPKEKDKVICETIDKDKFKRRKLIFDYWHDYTTLKGLISKSGDNCTSKYGIYLGTVEQAYSGIQKFCQSNQTDPYCSEFNKQCNQYCTNGKLNLKCPSAYTEQQEDTTLKAVTSPTANSIGTTAAAIPSALATLALPAAAFFLYKYNLLPSWISNQFNGGSNKRRGKRSAIRHNFDTSTDDNSTLYSTETGSTPDTSTHYSTDLSTTETDNSTIYGEQPSGRHRTEQQQQHQRGQRTNIRYHP
ncbi:KIR-like CYIR protein [Plasmodium coatneyi]|uniref:KIR-like CYIR protein n=1 Tax=Plasmodium coatneyi TaxID=208452 RepID=A0A1B1DX23_9APIC|nr:KIR-like CYIR protein [Plasmodium coatneyi]ANQ07361.1 KIR-like CYIR protein [Plasmodium coatneyi]